MKYLQEDGLENWRFPPTLEMYWYLFWKRKLFWYHCLLKFELNKNTIYCNCPDGSWCRCTLINGFQFPLWAADSCAQPSGLFQTMSINLDWKTGPSLLNMVQLCHASPTVWHNKTSEVCKVKIEIFTVHSYINLFECSPVSANINLFIFLFFIYLRTETWATKFWIQRVLYIHRDS